MDVQVFERTLLASAASSGSRINCAIVHFAVSLPPNPVQAPLLNISLPLATGQDSSGILPPQARASCPVYEHVPALLLMTGDHAGW